MGIPVQATEKGFYKSILRSPGSKFEVESEKHVGSWMQRLDGKGSAKKGGRAAPTDSAPEDTAPPADTAGSDEEI